MTALLLAVNLLATFILVLLVTGLLPAYVREKGKNLATKEDIEEITRKVEGIRGEYAQALQAQSDQAQGMRCAWRRLRGDSRRTNALMLSGVGLSPTYSATTSWRS